jgi:hypothetical protein
MPEMVWSFVGSLTRRGSPFVGPAIPMPIQRLSTKRHLPQIDASRQYAHKCKWIWPYRSLAQSQRWRRHVVKSRLARTELVHATRERRKVAVRQKENNNHQNEPKVPKCELRGLHACLLNLGPVRAPSTNFQGAEGSR